MDSNKFVYFLSITLLLGCYVSAQDDDSDSDEDCPKGDSFAEDHHDDDNGDHEHENQEMNGNDENDEDGDHDNDDDDHDDNDPDEHEDHEDCATTSHDFDGIWYYETMQKSPELKDFTLVTYVSTDANGVIAGSIFNIHSTELSFTVSGGMQNGTGYLKIIFSGQQRQIMTTFDPNTKYHVAIVINAMSNSATVFIDSKLLKQVSFSSITSLPANGQITIGHAIGSKYKPYKGNLQNLMLWNRMLSNTEIEEVYDENHCVHDPILTLHEHNMIPQKHGVPTVGWVIENYYMPNKPRLDIRSIVNILYNTECPKVKYSFNNTGDRVDFIEPNVTIPRLEFATACIKITTDALGIIPGTPGSYATAEEPESISVSGFINSKGEAKNSFVVQGHTFIVPGQFAPNTEYPICVAYHYKHNHLESYIFNMLITTIQYDGIGYMPGNGRIIFGQRQRKLGGCFDHPYMGTIEDFMYWGRILSREEIQGFIEDKCPIDNIF